MFVDVVSSVGVLAQIPDGDAALPDGMAGSLGTLVGWAKGFGYLFLVFLLIAAAVELAKANKRGGESMEVGGSFIKIFVAAVVIGSAVTIMEVFVG